VRAARIQLQFQNPFLTLRDDQGAPISRFPLPCKGRGSGG